MIEFYLGMTLTRFQSNEAKEREKVLEEAEEHLKMFHKWCQTYNLLDEQIERLNMPLAAFSSVREAKIARHRAMISYERQAEEASSLLDDDARIREQALASIHCKLIESQNELESIATELKILSETTGSSNVPKTAPLLYKRKCTSPTLKISQPFVLLRDRQQLSKNVFRPSHNLPTMTIDEYLELERRRGGIVEGAKTDTTAEKDSDKDEIADRQTMKDRLFDLIKDDNPRGWGNTYNQS